LQVKHRLALGLVFGLDNLAGFIFIASVQTGAFAGGGVHAIILSTAQAATS
jgi:TctA family transporter